MMRFTATALLGALLAAPAAAQSIDCANPACETKLSPACLQRVGAGSLPAGDACGAEQAAYVACLTAVAEQCAAAATPQKSGCGPEDAQQLYAELQDSQDAAALETFAKACPGSPQAAIASMRAERLRERQAASLNRRKAGLGQFTGQWVPFGFPEKGCPSQLLISSESGLLFVQAAIDDKLVRLGGTKRMEYRRFLMRGKKQLNFKGEPLAMTELAYTQEDGSTCRYGRPQ